MRTAKWKGDSHGKKRRPLIAKGRTEGQPKIEEEGGQRNDSKTANGMRKEHPIGEEKHSQRKNRSGQNHWRTGNTKHSTSTKIYVA